MATWDGSDQAGPSEDPNFYLYAHASNAAANPRTWDYYSTSGNDAYSHGSVELYAQNNLPNVAAQQGYQSATYQDSLFTAPVVDNAPAIVNNDRPCFFENNRPTQKLESFNSSRYSAPRQETNLGKQSNLHAGASEFVPTGRIKTLQKNTSAQSYNETDDTQYNDFASDATPAASHIFFSDNRNHTNDRRYDNSKNSNAYRGSNRGQRRRNNYQQQSYNGSRANDSSSAIAQDASLANNLQSEDNSYRGGSRSGPRSRDQRKYSRFQQQQPPPHNDKSRIDARKMPVDTWQNPADVQKDNTTSNDDPRENSNHNSWNNKAGRGKWTRYERKQYFEGKRQPPDNKPYPGSNDYEEQQSLYEAQTSGTGQASGRKENSQNREGDRNFYRNDRGRGKPRDGSSTNFDGSSGHSYYDSEGHGDNYERSRDDGKRLRESRDEEPQQSWRQKDKNNFRVGMQRKITKKIEFDDDASQRERLTEQLNQGQLECLICCDYIRQNDPVWSCNNCYHVLHLKCLKKWAHSSQGENGWRCPACQNVSLTVPEIYYCFCGKARIPEWNRRDTAHSCGEICGRLRAKNNCVHKCTLLCHPGSCPECIAMVTRHCGCGRTSQSIKCSTSTLVVCEAICEKTLNCNIHECEKICHHGDCGPCEKKLHQECHCGKNERDVTCTADVPATYSCGEICDKSLECGNHRCKELCHPDSCGACILQPANVTHCCCGQTPLTVNRESCLDPIPTCDKVCSKRLKCGQPSDPHTCKVDCHPEDCPECELTTKVRCRCGNMDREIACKELRTKADDARCEKKCTKKRSCGKHKCNQPCCIDIEHICPMPCSKSLNCGRHRCQLCCHKGRCQPCQQMSFDELHCECGASVIYPPVPCGTRRPTCNRPCSRQHACGHEVLHNCHSDPSCPPCTVLTQRWCYGKHELRKAVPCHVNEISCGLPCNKPITCGRHKCITLCHPGPCEKSGQVCTQPCTTPRDICGHICAAPCHEGKCPDVPCKETVKVTCTCGNRSMTRPCAENSRDFQRIASGILASKMADMQLGHSVDLEEVFGQGAKKQNHLKTLECNDECKIIARNRRIALGLQIVNPDVSGKLMPRYTESMKQWAKKDPHFCQMVHEKLTELVQLAKTSKQKSRSYSFDSMNRDKRNFIHESCEHFGCESQAYDKEPKRNVVATAVKDKCWLPAYSLLEIVQRENGQRKVPRPMLNSSKPQSTLRLSEVLSSTARASQKLQPAASTSKSPEPEIDYFDFPNGKAGKWGNV